MATLTVYSDAADGVVYSHNATYATARSGSGTTARTNLTNEAAGQELSGGEYWIYEVFLGWDTSSLGSGATISAAVASLHATATDNSVQDFTLQMRPSDWGTTLTAADFVTGATYNGLTISATKASSGWTTSAYNDLTETSTNLQTNINKTGFSRFVVCSDRFAAGTSPGVDKEYLVFFLGDEAGTTSDPKLVVTYTPAAIESGPLSVSATGAITVANTQQEFMSGALSVSATGTVDIVQSIRETFSGLDVSATGAIDIAFATRLVESGQLNVDAIGLINIVQSVREIVSGALGISASALITISDSSIDDDILRVFLTATYLDGANGDPARGKVTFKLTDEIRDAIGNIIAARVRHKAHLRDGTFTIQLPVATGGVDYVVVEEIVGADKRRFTVTIPATPATQTLAEVI